jgi:hypothetical protein
MEKQHVRKTLKMRHAFRLHLCSCFNYFSTPFGDPERHRKVAETYTGAGETHVAMSSFLMNVDFPPAGPARIDFKREPARTQKGNFSSNSLRTAIKNECFQGDPRNELSQ